MGKGIQLARAAGAGIHADVLDDFKDQLLLVLVRRLQSAEVREVIIDVEDIDDTGGWILSFSVREGQFHFIAEKKQ